MASIIDIQFTEWFNQIARLYADDKLDECIDEGKKLLADGACPRYHRMRALVLVGSILGDWDEANECCTQADVLWRIVRHWHGRKDVEDQTPDDKNFETTLVELRELIDELKELLEEEGRGDFDADEEVDNAIAAHDAFVEEEEAIHQAEFGAENKHDKETASPPKTVVATGGEASELSVTRLPDRTVSGQPTLHPNVGRASTTTPGPGSALLSPMYIPPARRRAPGQRTEEILRKASWRKS